jgi:hypothetical protein
MVLVKNNSTSVFGTTVKENGNSVHIVLSPGINEISNPHWEKMKHNPLIQKRINDGLIEAAAGAEETNGDLSKLHHKQATKIIEETFDVKLLGRWLDGETRPAVQRAITAQIDKLKIDVKPEAENTEEFL